VEASAASREHIAAYVRDLTLRPRRSNRSSVSTGCANATLQLRLTAVRLFHDYLIEEGIRSHNPVGRGRYTPGKTIPGPGERGLIPRYRRLPWIPSDEEWSAILAAARVEPLRNRVMLAIAYGSALRREELCSLRTEDVDPARRLLRIRPETTKNRQERVVPYSAAIGTLYAAYLEHRRSLSHERGPLFLSESHRNRAAAVSIWTWTKVVQSIAERSCVRHLTTHAFRHLCLTDLARMGWDVHEIAAFAGHRSPQTTLLYIHLSGRELAAKLENGMAKIHAWRVAMAAEVLR
jgi:integrase